MADKPDEAAAAAVHVTAEEHIHPAVRKLSRALIMLARVRLTEPAGGRTGGSAESEIPMPRPPADEHPTPPSFNRETRQ
jgi:hypothetical protein